MPLFAEVNVGDALPTLEKSPGRRQLVQYAAGSGDFNPLHYDADFPQAKAIGDNIVHGRMKYACLGELTSNWLASTVTLPTERYNPGPGLKVKTPLPPSDTLAFKSM